MGVGVPLGWGVRAVVRLKGELAFAFSARGVWDAP